MHRFHSLKQGKHDLVIACLALCRVDFVQLRETTIFSSSYQMDGLGKDSMCHDSCFRAGARVRVVDAPGDASLSLSKTR